MDTKLTKKAFREYLNENYKGMKHKHNQFHQLKRPYGDYLYYQDRVKFNANYEEWLKENANTNNTEGVKK